MLGNAYRLVDHLFFKSCKDTTGNDPFGALEEGVSRRRGRECQNTKVATYTSKKPVQIWMRSLGRFDDAQLTMITMKTMNLS